MWDLLIHVNLYVSDKSTRKRLVFSPINLIVFSKYTTLEFV